MTVLRSAMAAVTVFGLLFHLSWIHCEERRTQQDILRIQRTIESLEARRDQAQDSFDVGVYLSLFEETPTVIDTVEPDVRFASRETDAAAVLSR